MCAILNPACVAMRVHAVLCREEAQELAANKPKLDQLGVKLVGVVKEWDEAEIKVIKAAVGCLDLPLGIMQIVLSRAMMWPPALCPA